MYNVYENNLKNFLPGLLKLNYFNITTFCEAMGIQRNLYYQWIDNRRKPCLASMLKMADVLRCSPKEVMEQVRPNKKFYKDKVY